MDQNTEQEQTQDVASAGTAIARAKPQLPADVQREIEERKLRNAVAAQIAGLSWGKDLDLVSRRALADYCRERGIDAATEIHILGGRLYKNGEFYLNRAQPLVRAGILDLQYEYVNVDARLDKLAQSTNPETASKARELIDYRTLRRIELNIPEAAQSAVIATVILLKHGTKLQAAKWCGGGTRKKDPVGDENPEATAVTRAFRKALKMAVGHEQQVARVFGELDGEDGELTQLETVLSERRAYNEAIEAPVRENQRKALANVPSVQYDPSEMQRLTPEQLSKIAERPDPYVDSTEPGGIPPLAKDEKVAALHRIAETAMPLPAITPTHDPDDPGFGDMFNDDPPARRDALREGH